VKSLPTAFEYCGEIGRSIGEEEIDIYGLADTNYVKTRRDGRLDIKARPEIVRRSRTRKTQMISEIKLQTYASALDR
jgi:hypothetical protein